MLAGTFAFARSLVRSNLMCKFRGNLNSNFRPGLTAHNRYFSYAQTHLKPERIQYLEQHIDELVLEEQKPVTVRQFADFARNRASSEAAYKGGQFVIQQLPIRIANIYKFISDLPEDLASLSCMHQLKTWYLESLDDIVTFKEQTHRLSQDEFCRGANNICQTVLKRHSGVVVMMARGLREVQPTRTFQKFLNRLYLSRIGTRLLQTQHLNLFDEMDESAASHGMFEEDIDLDALVEEAVNNARHVGLQTYMDVPKFNIVNVSSSNAPFTYVTSHIYHIVFEIIKNSLRATIEHYGEDYEDEYPEITIVICLAAEDLTIKISDVGGGIARKDVDKLFTYSYTTGEDFSIWDYEGDVNHAPLAGYGYGLPLSRLYARTFGGDLKLISIEGYGTDSYIYLKALAPHAKEVLVEYPGKVSSSFWD